MNRKVTIVDYGIGNLYSVTRAFEASGATVRLTANHEYIEDAESVVLPGVPRLFISRSGGNALISWTPGTPGFVLQGNGSASSLGWADAPSGSTNPASVPAAGTARFYRLRKP